MDSLTLSVVSLAILFLLIYDVWTVLKRGSNTTISVQVYSFSKEYPMVPFLIGFVFGHIFWGM